MSRQTIIKLSAPILRNHIGKRLYWEGTRDPHRGATLKSGIVESVSGRNVVIDGEYHWYSDLNNPSFDKHPEWEESDK